MKSQIIANIRQDLTNKSSLTRRLPNDGDKYRIISVDMGLKNFALTKLALNKRLPFNTVPMITEWDKYDVQLWANVGTDDTFEPQKYVEPCYRLVNEILLPRGEPLPDALLIERQRSRSGGSPVVNEWVFRVNMLEAMVHSMVYSRICEERSKIEVISASPQRMGYYWKPLDDEVKGKVAKKFRVGYVEQLLADFVQSSDPKISVDPHFALQKFSGDYFSQVMNSSQSHSRGTFGAEKGDDLVDALLHALAWIQWQANKTVMKLEFISGVEDAMKKVDELYQSHTEQMGNAWMAQQNKAKKGKGKPTVATTKHSLKYDPNATKAVEQELDSIEK